MKKFILSLMLFATWQITTAQTITKSDIDMVREVFGKEIKMLTDDLLQLSAADAEKFWPIWDDYRAERATIGDKRMSLIKEYADNYENMSNEKADALAKGFLQNDADLVKLKAKYYKKTKKAVSATKAAQFIQLESYIDSQIRAEVSDALPFMPDAKN